MSKSGQIQDILFKMIKSKLSPNISFVHDLSELLGISYNSAYRRIRGEKELSLEELKSICVHYDISVDALFNLQTDHVIFDPLRLVNMDLTLRIGLFSLLEGVKMVYNSHQREIIYAAKDLPCFLFF